jgi:DNA processing protein
MTEDLDRRYAAGLAALGASPARLRRFLDGYTPEEAWEALARGRHLADPDGSYRPKMRTEMLDTVERACDRAEVTISLLGRPGYPGSLAGDREAPAVLFSRGDLSILSGMPRVTVVGTRSATPYGLGVAAELGEHLAGCGVVVISGLARGVDSAAHHGALRSRNNPGVAGVLGTAVDAPATKAQCALREAVAASGVLLSELPPGVTGARWWFAVRNRVMAALAHVVVVVECHGRGGSLHTVEAARDRGLMLMAVPGSVRSPASVGTNALLVDGIAPARNGDDVITAIELTIAKDFQIEPPRRRLPASARPSRRREPTALARRVRCALSQDPTHLDQLVAATGLSVGEVSLGLEQLTDSAWAVGEGGWWSLPQC